MISQARIVNVLAEDRGLGEDIEARRRAAATRAARALLIALPRGDWSEVRWPMCVRRGAGLLVMDGLLLRHVGIEGRKTVELLGAGDLLRPWQREDNDMLAEHCGWWVCSRARLAVLDVSFMKRIAPYPEIQSRLVERATSRARRLALAMAIVSHPTIDARLRMMLWQLAEHWGSEHAEGLLVPKLTQEVLAELIAARRPTVSSALTQMERQGEIARSSEGWVLRARQEAPRTVLADRAA